MKLIDQKRFPHVVQLFFRVFVLGNQRKCSCIFQIMQSSFTFPVKLFYPALGSVSTSVSSKIQFSTIGVRGSSFFIQPFKKRYRISLFYFNAALQILLSPDIFHMISCGASAAVTISIGNQKIFQMMNLHPLFPYPVHFLRICIVVIAGR